MEMMICWVHMLPVGVRTLSYGTSLITQKQHYTSEESDTLTWLWIGDEEYVTISNFKALQWVDVLCSCVFDGKVVAFVPNKMVCDLLHVTSESHRRTERTFSREMREECQHQVQWMDSALVQVNDCWLFPVIGSYLEDCQQEWSWNTTNKKQKDYTINIS